ncbi:MAG: hypothetical protein J5758_02390 [Abditibacteriota bacterium]|nr:hypothetical protein [Abditibacteriota bacterium]
MGPSRDPFPEMAKRYAFDICHFRRDDAGVWRCRRDDGSSRYCSCRVL